MIFKMFEYMFHMFIISLSGVHLGRVLCYRLDGVSAALSNNDYEFLGSSDKEAVNPKDEDVFWLNPGKRGSPNFTPYISVGVLSNLEEFFDNLSSNINKFDEDDVGDNEIDDPQLRLKNSLTDHFLREYKPSHKIRKYVQSPELGLLKNTNRYNPSFMWSGLGKRSRTYTQ